MKTVNELAIPLENKPGALADISEQLAANAIAILALTVRTERDSGVLHIVTSDPSRSESILRSAGYDPHVNRLLAVETPYHPGGLNTVFKSLKSAGLNIEYLYSFVGTTGDGANILLMKLNDDQQGHDTLRREWIRLFGEEIYSY